MYKLLKPEEVITKLSYNDIKKMKSMDFGQFKKLVAELEKNNVPDSAEIYLSAFDMGESEADYFPIIKASYMQFEDTETKEPHFEILLDSTEPKSLTKKEYEEWY